MNDIKIKKNELRPVIYMSWEESERNWGIRPDGCSLHITENDYEKFEKDYWETMKKTYGNRAPDEYSKPAGRPVTVSVSEKLYEKIKNSVDGLFLSVNEEREAVKNEDLKYGSERSGWVSIDSQNSRDAKISKLKSENCG